MRNFNLLFTFALSLAASASAHANPEVAPGLVARQTNTQATQTSQTSQATQGSKTIVDNAVTPTGGQGDAVQGDVDTTLSTDTPESTAQPVTTTDKNGSTITEMPPTQTGSKTTTSKKIKISADAQPGGVQMMTPSVLDGYQIYKIGDPITFAWNFTSLQVTPTALNVQAFCTDGAQFFPIAVNISAATTEVVWDTGAYQSSALSKLPMATYTLYIYDETRGATSFPSPGYLYPFSGLTFGMYTPQAPTPLASFQCATCDPSAASLIDPKALHFLLGMGLVTALSFMWFVAGVL